MSSGYECYINKVIIIIIYTDRVIKQIIQKKNSMKRFENGNLIRD